LTRHTNPKSSGRKRVPTTAVSSDMTVVAGIQHNNGGRTGIEPTLLPS